MRLEEESGTGIFLGLFRTALVEQVVVDAAGAIYRKWHPSHGTDIHDALLAATAMKTGGTIYCLNRKHYPTPDITVERAW